MSAVTPTVLHAFAATITAAMAFAAYATPNGGNPFIAGNDVTWTTLGTNENDSMPIGNGDMAANVWTDQNGDLVLLLAKSDAWTEMGILAKLGRIRIELTPNPFVATSDFTQVLKLEDGAIEIRNGGNSMRIWVDANHPVLHAEAHLDHPADLQADLELWRTTTHPFSEQSPERGGLFEFDGGDVPIDFEADTVLPPGTNSLTSCHFNRDSIYPLVLRQEHVQSLVDKFPDPLLHRCFGARLTGPGMISDNDHTLKSAAPSRNFRLDLYALTKLDAASPQAWETSLESLEAQVQRVPLPEAWRAHQQWWKAFWNRSWIHVDGTPAAAEVSQSYVMQRYMMACSSRGAQPVKFNGGLFTVGHDLPKNQVSTMQDHSPDFRQWGSCYWNQNNRLLYWPLIATGDYDLLKPWFEMYLNALPLEKARTWIYDHHGGASFPETMYFWGLPNIHDFGWNNPSNVIQSRWQRYHIQGALEVALQMLDYYDDTEDTNFARTAMVPFADAIVTYYYFQYPHLLSDGKIQIAPAQSLETYQLRAINPTPDIAGLKAVISRLLALPKDVTTEQQREFWAKTFKDLPAIPMGKTAHGKIPPFGVGDPDGTPVILPAEKYGNTRNAENPELYVAFPYRLYGLGKPDLQLARNTFNARLFPMDTVWGQDGTQAAVLGLTHEARRVVISEFTHYGNQRFRWFWKPGDEIPDLQDGGTGMITLQLMLMQCDGKRILLLPAWPADWTADFKLHAPYRTTVEGRVNGGKITILKVAPAFRAKDVVVEPIDRP